MSKLLKFFDDFKDSLESDFKNFDFKDFIVLSLTLIFTGAFNGGPKPPLVGCLKLSLKS